MTLIPHEFILIAGIYMSPLFVSGLLAVFATTVTVRVLNRYRLSRYFAYPPVVALSLVVVYTVLIGTFLIPA